MTFYRHETARRLNHLLSAGHDLHIHGKRYAPKVRVYGTEPPFLHCRVEHL